MLQYPQYPIPSYKYGGIHIKKKNNRMLRNGIRVKRKSNLIIK